MSGFKLELAAGSSRSGKSFLTAQRIKRDKNVFVWDSMAEFSAMRSFITVRTARDLQRIAARALPGRYAYVAPVTRESFDFFCRCTWLWLRATARRGARVTVVVEELADVTAPGKAPPAWGELIRKSLRFQPHIYALTQSPAESDKTVMRNATVLRCHAMARHDDRKAMAKELDVSPEQIAALDFSRFQYLERDRMTSKLTGGGKGRPPKIPR